MGLASSLKLLKSRLVIADRVGVIPSFTRGASILTRRIEVGEGHAYQSE